MYIIWPRFYCLNTFIRFFFFFSTLFFCSFIHKHLFISCAETHKQTNTSIMLTLLFFFLSISYSVTFLDSIWMVVFWRFWCSLILVSSHLDFSFRAYVSRISNRTSFKLKYVLLPETFRSFAHFRSSLFCFSCLAFKFLNHYCAHCCS